MKIRLRALLKKCRSHGSTVPSLVDTVIILEVAISAGCYRVAIRAPALSCLFEDPDPPMPRNASDIREESTLGVRTHICSRWFVYMLFVHKAVYVVMGLIKVAQQDKLLIGTISSVPHF